MGENECQILEAKIEAMDKRVENIEDHCHNIDKRLVELESTRPYLVKMLEENKESNKELNKTMLGLQEFIANVTNKLDEQGKKIDNVGKRVRELDEMIRGVDEKGKFDMREWLKKNFPWIVVIVGFGIYYASQNFKF